MQFVPFQLPQADGAGALRGVGVDGGAGVPGLGQPEAVPHVVEERGHVGADGAALLHGGEPAPHHRQGQRGGRRNVSWPLKSLNFNIL